MKPQARRIIVLTTLALAICPCGTASTRQNPDDAAIDAYIARQAKLERGEEYREVRKVVVGDLTHDGVPETVVLYVIEGQGGTNRSLQYLAVFARRNGRLTLLTHAEMGSKSVAAVELRSVENETIVLGTLSYGPTDANCCPSVPGTTRYVLSGRTLREQKQGASKGRHN
jgi:hypothetical protein